MGGIEFHIAARDGMARTGRSRRRGAESARRPSCRSDRRDGQACCPSVRATGADVILGNTYHLMLPAGAERVALARRAAPVP